MHAFFLRKACRNSGNFAELSQDFETKVASSRRRAAAFSDLNARLTQSRASVTPYVLQSARWPRTIQFCARNALKFQNFYNSFVKVLRKFCVVSTLDAYLFGPDRTFDFTESNKDVKRLAQRTLAECTHFFCARRAEIPESLQNFRRILKQNLRHLNAARQLFRI